MKVDQDRGGRVFSWVVGDLEGLIPYMAMCNNRRLKHVLILKLGDLCNKKCRIYSE